MAGVFISHSSRDKPVVSKLAVDLALEGIPVWFDSWEMELGDSLYDRIFEGIDNSTYLILVLSDHSVASKWVQKELKGALNREDALERKIILPVRLDDCEIPSMIADRICADMSDGYPQFIDGLIGLLKSKGLDKVGSETGKFVVPIKIRQGHHINDDILDDILEDNRVGPDNPITRQSLVFADDAQYYELRHKFFEAIARFENDPKTPHGALDHMELVQKRSRQLDASLVDGVVAIANNAERSIRSEAIRWFIKIIRTDQILSFQIYAGTDELCPLGELKKPPMMNPDFFEALYGDSDYVKMEVFPESMENSFSFHAPRSLIELEDPVPGQYVPASLFLGLRVEGQFMIPQMVAHHFQYQKGGSPLEWKFRGWKIGFS
ncbi:toll/interleukin-1 receptor domain-containing protein [Hoeflea sp.]|uniref:toll/interleukin-1 receptor domain-containing protein n=1 Tax=Hoeflea sp. TaxID=1940281 RepID=UPI003B02CE17